MDFGHSFLEHTPQTWENLIRKILLFANEIFDPNYKHKKTFLMQLRRVLTQELMKASIPPGPQNSELIIAVWTLYLEHQSYIVFINFRLIYWCYTERNILKFFEKFVFLTYVWTRKKSTGCKIQSDLGVIKPFDTFVPFNTRCSEHPIFSSSWCLWLFTRPSHMTSGIHRLAEIVWIVTPWNL